MGVVNKSLTSAGLNCKQRVVTTGASKAKPKFHRSFVQFILYSIPFGFCLHGTPHEPSDIRYALKIWNVVLDVDCCSGPQSIVRKMVVVLVG